MEQMKTVKKAIMILESFEADKKYQGITELSKKFGMQKSTIHSLLNTLKENGYIIYNPINKKYCLGLKILELAKRVSYPNDLRKIALPFMEDLAAACEEDIALNILVEGRRLCIELVESRFFVRQIVPLNKPLPLHCSAAGKAILAFQKESEIQAIVSRHGLPRFTPRTITDPAVLFDELNAIRSQGYAESREEYGRDAAAVAFPILGKDGNSVGSLSVQSTINRINENTSPFLIREGRKATEKINSILKENPYLWR